MRGLIGSRFFVGAGALSLLMAVALAFALPRSASPSSDASIRAAIGRYLAEPAVVFPICVSKHFRGYARAGAYPLPFGGSFPLQLVLARGKGGWRVVAWNDYAATGWLAIPGHTYPRALLREAWCKPVPHTPATIRSALHRHAAVISTFGMTYPYVPEVGVPVYRPEVLGFSGDGGAIYYINRWLSYGKRSAKARATWGYNPCRPTCATNKRYTRVKFVLTLTDPKPCDGVVAYTILTVSYSTNTKLLPDTSRSLELFCKLAR